MFPFYDDVIAPILRASGAQRILEIGIRQGATTGQLLERLGPGVELHAIDPVPDFDATELARKFPGRYVVHADTSHNVLPQLSPFDVALIDGDHNWFTVYHELRMLSETSRSAACELPVLILHDVGWPYGRRDLYYDPSRIPAEYRQEYAQRGLHPARKGFVSGSGGLNAAMCNAVEEGGARNGVMTAVDDFVAAYDSPLRTLVLPIYFGLAIVATEARLARHPELASVLDWLESADGKQRLLELSESIRLRGMANQRNVVARETARFEAMAARYVRLLSATLIDERCTDGAGSLEQLVDALDTVRTAGVAGDVVTCGPDHRRAAMLVHGYLDAYDLTDRELWVVDTDHERWAPAAFDQFDLPESGVRFLDARDVTTSAESPIGSIALLHLAGDFATHPATVVDVLCDKVATGGFVVVDPVAAASGAVDDFARRSDMETVSDPTDAHGVRWRKRSSAVGVAR